MCEIKLKVWGHLAGEEYRMFDCFDLTFQDGIPLPPRYNGEPICDHAFLRFAHVKDKNKKDVYQGDIVNTGNVIGVIEWDAPYQRFHYTTFHKAVGNVGSAGGLYYFHGEVVGNIYEDEYL